MKKSSCLIKAFLISLIFLCFISCGNDSVMYQLTLDGNGATTHEMTRVYYNATNKKWYREVGIASPITQVTIPKRQFTLKYDFDGKNVTNNVPVVTANYSFTSYPGYTDSQGNIISSVALKSGEVATASWVAPDKDGTFSVALPSVTPSATGYRFLGWKKDKSSSHLYKSEEVVTISENEIKDNSFTMVASWEESDEVRLNVKYDSESDGEFYTYKKSDGKWYSSLDVEQNRISIPVKDILIMFDPNQSGVSTVPGGTTQKSTFKFLGYSDASGTQFIDENGILTRDNQKIDGNIGKTIEVVATWGEQTPITLPELTKNGMSFEGWNTSGSSVQTTLKPGLQYKPTQNENKSTLKGVWTSNAGYTLTLDNNGATSLATNSAGEELDKTEEGLEVIYYRIGDTWYSDSSFNNILDKINPPKKIWTVEYDSNVKDGEGDSFPIQPSTTEIEFEGFYVIQNDIQTNKKVISSDGIIDTTYIMTGDGKVKAEWKYEPVGETTNAILNATKTLTIKTPKNITREGFTLLGWDEDKDATTPTYTDNITFKNNEMKLFAIWHDDRVWKLTVNNVQSENTSGMVSKDYYYKPGANKWYKTQDDASYITTIDEKDKNRIYDIFFDSNLNGVADLPNGQYKYVFGGSTINNGEEDIVIIAEDGTLLPLPSDNIKSVDLIWNDGSIWYDGVEVDNVSASSIPISASDSKYTHLGWSLTQNGEIIETLPAPTKNTTLYAIWQNDNVYKLTLDSNGATVPSSSEVFYKVSDRKWYSQETCAPEKEITKITIPEKVWTANFDLNYSSSDVNPEPLTSTWTFKGYSPYINESGNFTTVGIVSPLTIKAMWDGQQSIQMPEVTRDNYIFMGWNKSGELNRSDDPYINGKYLIKLDDLNGGSSVTFRAVWKPETYKLTLDDNAATTPSCGSVYYVFDKGWFSDEKGENPIDKIEMPKKEINVTFVSSLEASIVDSATFVTSKVVTSEAPFNGYSASKDGVTTTYILNDGTIQGTLTEPVKATASWGEMSEATIPQTKEVDGHVFDKWVRSEDKESSEDKNKKPITTPYTPEKNGEVIEGIWIDAYAFGREAFVLVGNNYVFDPDGVDLSRIPDANKKNFAIPTTFDNRVGGSGDRADVSNDVPSGVYEVTGFGSGKFTNEKTPASINIPSTITSIPEDLFRDCTNLETIILPENFTQIGSNAFSGCTNLKKIVFGGNEEAWDNDVSKGGGWNSGTGTISVVCSDKTIQVKENATNNALVEVE